MVFYAIYKIAERKVKRREGDKPLIENHKLKMRPPTWKFQKYHPSNCPHNNGIYRKVKYNILNETIEKKVFVCSDCVSVIEINEL